MTQKVLRFNLEERRTRLRELMRNEDAAFEDYHAVISGATEEERKSLARTLSLKKLIARYEYEGTAEQRLVCVYVAAALGSTFKHIGVYLENLINRGLPNNGVGRNFSSPESENYLQQRVEAMILGLKERDNVWFTEFVDECGYMRFRYDSSVWASIHRLLHERGLTNTTRPYLWGLVRALPVLKANSTENYAETIAFFKENPQTLEHELWDWFKYEGFLQKYWPEHGYVDILALFHLLQDNFDGFRNRLLDECLESMLRDFSSKNTSIFHYIYRGMSPTPEENSDRANLLISILTTAPSASVGLGQEALATCVVKLTDHQHYDLLDTSQAVLMRTEKKVLRTQIKLLGAMVKAHPEYARDVSELMAEAMNYLPSDLQFTAQKLIVSSDPETDKTNVSNHPENTENSVVIPENTPYVYKPHESSPQTYVYMSDTEFMEDFIPCLQGTGDGSRLPQLIVYLAHHPRITLDKSQQEFLAEQCVNSGIHTGIHALRNYLIYRVIAPHRKLFKKPPQGFQGYLHEFHTNPQTGEPLYQYQAYQEDYPAWRNHHIERVRTNYRGPLGLCQEQIEGLDHPEDLILEPLPPTEINTWKRVVEHYEARPHSYDSISTTHYDETVIYAPQLSLMMWLNDEDTQLPHAQMSFKQAALNTAGIPEEYTQRTWAHGVFYPTLMQWYAWLLQNNPNTLAAQSIPFVTTTGSRKHVMGLDAVLGALSQTHQILLEPAYSVLGWVAGARAAEHRVLAAEAIATLADRGMLDVSLLTNELVYLLQNGWVKPVTRVASCLQDTASISPLAGWRVLQILEGMLPIVSDLKRGGSLVQLLVQLAGEYGVSVEIPEALCPKMKGSTVLAKSLRALERLQPHPTELAEQAREEALLLSSPE